ncbi:MAG: hypothetical protein KAG61_13455 [Bacteriovoracaceae bacterium]|nr:hypothetical protein [Bacteriovoracaceae bacterium]
MDVSRYSKILTGIKREIVLLRSFPCKWGRCTFCDYIDDNGEIEKELVEFNEGILSQVTGEYGHLEIVNSGSVYELPDATRLLIDQIVKERGIQTIYFESHWLYKNQFQELRDHFDIPVIIKVGVESFDDDFRNRVLKKGMVYNSIEEVAETVDSVCLMVGIVGQTKEMIRRDIDILLKHFKYGCINVFIENTTPLKRDEELVEWFYKEYRHLENVEKIDVLFDNKDFGVFT